MSKDSWPDISEALTRDGNAVKCQACSRETGEWYQVTVRDKTISASADTLDMSALYCESCWEKITNLINQFLPVTAEYRHKPNVVRATQCTTSRSIESDVGRMIAKTGDYIVTDGDKQWVMTQDRFDKVYDKV